ncbi:hypothetical protein [Candidatus Hecatella orcuttiae]|uniref:hypothetical protein n=1 Tax=Candidatus Hecatella orcuttiae TaxID=1935119 RepID=UPI002867C12B|nr:hypothetical protein [Candidatus Hecatella orcuttiae]
MERGSYPPCPNCDGVLIPFSALGTWGGQVAAKTFAHWVCIKCGFYMGTGSKAGGNLVKDLEIMICEDIKRKIEKVIRK